MIIETEMTPPTPAAEPPAAGPTVAVLGPSPGNSTLPGHLATQGITSVPLPPASSPESRAAAVVAALACDLVALELPAGVGIDAGTPQVWQWLASAGMPRMVVVTGLGDGSADFDDLVAIAQRVLGEDCVPVRLPVFDDDERPAASLDLSRGLLDTLQGQMQAETGHLTVAAGDLSALLSALSTTVPDDATATEYLSRLHGLDEQLPGEPPVGGAVHLGMPQVGHGGSALPKRMPGDVADAVHEGLLAPIVAATGEGAWVRDAAKWGQSTTTPADRLVRRDVHGEPTGGWAGVVLASAGDSALIRPVYGEPEPGYALITAVGSDRAGAPVPHRAWPTELGPWGEAGQRHATEPPGAPRRPGWWSTTVRMAAGDTVAQAHVWLIPAESADL